MRGKRFVHAIGQVVDQISGFKLASLILRVLVQLTTSDPERQVEYRLLVLDRTTSKHSIIICSRSEA